MTLTSAHPKSKLMKTFCSFGAIPARRAVPERPFFFDCLAVCINVKLAPEKREFWGWWIELEPSAGRFTYVYQLGLFNKEGNWNAEKISDPEVQDKLESTLRSFICGSKRC